MNELEEGDGLSMISANVTPMGEKQQQQKTPQSTPARPPPQPKPKVNYSKMNSPSPLSIQDLSGIPIYLTEAQRDLFFKPLKYLFNQNLQNDGLCQCGECGDMLKSVKVKFLKAFANFKILLIEWSPPHDIAHSCYSNEVL